MMQLLVQHHQAIKHNTTKKHILKHFVHNLCGQSHKRTYLPRFLHKYTIQILGDTQTIIQTTKDKIQRTLITHVELVTFPWKNIATMILKETNAKKDKKDK